MAQRWVEGSYPAPRARRKAVEASGPRRGRVGRVGLGRPTVALEGPLVPVEIEAGGRCRRCRRGGATRWCETTVGGGWHRRGGAGSEGGGVGAVAGDGRDHAAVRAELGIADSCS